MPRRKRASPVDNFMDMDDGEIDSTRHPQRNAANARERARMRVLSKAFCRLKTTLPWVPADTKLSKLDTLRLATSYIAHLRAVLTDQPLDCSEQKHPLSLTWPFSFQSNSMNNQNESTNWNHTRDSEEETSCSTTNNYVMNGDIIRDFAPYYQQYTDSLMHMNSG